MNFKNSTTDENQMQAVIGPQSVGYKLTKEAKCFGGNVLTTTDIAVGDGFAQIPKCDSSKVGLTQNQYNCAKEKIVQLVEDLVDRMKTSKDPVPLILVGGGSILIPESAQIEGVNNIIRPPHFGVANAVGAANAQISATIDTVISFDKGERSELIEEIKNQAIEKAGTYGAEKSSIRTTIDEIDMAYMPGKSRLIVKAIGDVDFTQLNLRDEKEEKQKIGGEEEEESKEEIVKEEEVFIEEVKSRDEEYKRMVMSEPCIVENEGRKEWVLSTFDIDCLRIGAGILGTGGGGSPYLGQLILKDIIKKGKKIRVISPNAITQNEYTMMVAFYGAPLVMIEKLAGSCEVQYSAKSMIEFQNLLGKHIPHVISAEIGGLNSMIPLWVGAMLDLTIVDGDFMGRAFPELQVFIVIKCV